MRHAQAERSSPVAQFAPLLARAIPHIAHPAIRNRGTIGGSLSHADPAAELPMMAMLLDAQLRVVSPGGERTVAAHHFLIYARQVAHQLERDCATAHKVSDPLSSRPLTPAL